MSLSQPQLHSSLSSAPFGFPGLCWGFQHCSSAGLSPRDVLALGTLLWGFNTWAGTQAQGHSAKTELMPVLSDALAAPIALTSQRASWPSPEVGK